MVRLLLALAGVACFGSFAWAVKGHFRSLDRPPRGMQMISILSIAAVGWFLLRIEASPPGRFWPLALAMMAGAQAMFWWAVATTRVQRLTLAFETDTPAFLYKTGPFRYVRHPFYGIYLLFWTSTSIATSQIVAWIVPLTFALVYFLAARREEDKFAHSALAEYYQRYRIRTGMFFPAGLWRTRR